MLPTAPLGPPPCLQTGGIGGPTAPCSYKNHFLTPNEVTVLTGGEATFQVHVCMNRSHLLNDWMFGFVKFVNITGQ